jgi:S1-C subfamily serine protease
MLTEEHVAQASVQILAGDSRGSGFRLLAPEIVVTNHHVVSGDPGHARARLEDGTEAMLEYLGGSAAPSEDFAIYRANSLPACEPLEPGETHDLVRGREVVFAGFPHGIEHLLSQRAIVAGHLSEGAFYIDGSVNGGNSGGPIVDRTSGAAIGVVTQRRFLGGRDLESMAEEAEKIARHCAAIQGQGGVAIMGIDFGGFAGMLSQSNLLLRDALEANANAGLGIGYEIDRIAEACRSVL